MSQSAYIKLVPESAAEQLTLEDVEKQLEQYRQQTALTGRQLGWNYSEAAFPYEVKSSGDDRWFYLQGINSHYRHIIIGLGDYASAAGDNVPCIQMVLPDEATHGDKAKGNELSKYLAKAWKAELTMFNGRTVYYYPRK
ncbi:DUF1885 family protein [Paenibacillus sp. J5C_2022]|uniref:DUF1885 family protein n=1 Tax=Paenibacillus sp. J5C2022 TaxID=2977129 RepID=UPI0021D279A1|nr:DUF1885 family protein [Paenibacillus sp. J5C2022]MCU6709007.1 DUF1885 family protein [Paenibacillus sp. J5C2022]